MARKLLGFGPGDVSGMFWGMFRRFVRLEPVASCLENSVSSELPGVFWPGIFWPGFF